MDKNAFTNNLWLVFSDVHLDGLVLSTTEVKVYNKKERGYVTCVQLDTVLNKYEWQQLVNSVPKLDNDELLGAVKKVSAHKQ